MCVVAEYPAHYSLLICGENLDSEYFKDELGCSDHVSRAWIGRGRSVIVSHSLSDPFSVLDLDLSVPLLLMPPVAPLVLISLRVSYLSSIVCCREITCLSVSYVNQQMALEGA